MTENIKLIIKGGVVGIANIIPGVSGGTLAVVLGIYEQLIEAIGNFFINRSKRKTYFFFLLKILGGAGLAILIFSWIMDYLLIYYESYTYLFFIGLIAGSIPAIYQSHPHMELSLPSVLTFVAGAGLILFLSMNFPQPGNTVKTNPVFVFSAWNAFILIFAGILSGGSMIVPGISGSFMLVLLGQYHVVIRAVKTVHLLPLIFLGLGIAAGIWLFAKIIDLLLKKFPKETFYFILGLVVASIYPIFPKLPSSPFRIILAFIIAGIAGLISYKIGDRKKEPYGN